MTNALLIISFLMPAAALFRAPSDRVFPIPAGLIFAAYPPMGYSTR